MPIINSFQPSNNEFPKEEDEEDQQLLKENNDVLHPE